VPAIERALIKNQNKTETVSSEMVRLNKTRIKLVCPSSDLQFTHDISEQASGGEGGATC